MIRVVQNIASTDDAAIQAVNTANQAVYREYLVLSHLPAASNAPITVKVNGVEIATGFPGSGAEYELKRISESQTVIRKRTPGSVELTIDGLEVINVGTIPLPIGRAVIGKTFRIR